MLPNTPRLAIASAPSGTKLVNQRPRFVSRYGRCSRRHFQKNDLISETFDPPEMYSRLLSKIESTIEPTYGLPSASVSFTLNFACWPGLYDGADGEISMFNTRLAGGTQISRDSV